MLIFAISRSKVTATWDVIHQLLNIILKLRILFLLPVSTMPYVCVCDRIFYGEDVLAIQNFYLVIIALSDPDC
jgi:hypothetical protein